MDPVVSELEQRERIMVLSDVEYANMMLGYLNLRSPMHVKFLWKRLPEQLMNHPLLVRLRDIAKAIRDKNFAQAHFLFGTIDWPDSLKEDSQETKKYLENMSYNHICEVYSNITVERFAQIAGLTHFPPAEVVAYAIDLGLEFDKNSQLLSTASCSYIPEDDDGEESSDLDMLQSIRDSVWSVGKIPFVVGDKDKSSD